QRILAREGERTLRLFRAEIQPLEHDAAVAALVELDERDARIRFDPVFRVAGEKAPQKSGLPKVEHTPVVGLVDATGIVEEPQGVVAELLPDFLALADRDQVDANTAR